MSVSFDFDGVLDDPIVQEYAKSLIQKNINVYICTFRKEDQISNSNNDLIKIAKKIGIPLDNIIYTNNVDKGIILKNYNFIWHLDDDIKQLESIVEHTKIKAILKSNTGAWIGHCERLLNLYK
jgi:hypothetical protein